MSDEPSAAPTAEPGGGTPSDNPDAAAGEYAKQVEAGIAVQLSEQLMKVRDRLVGAFGDLEVSGFRGELTLVVPSARIVDVLRFCRDDPELACELLTDLSAVHWPGGKRVENAQETTGWPTYESGDEEGRIELDYILYSITHNHRFRLRVTLPDDDPRVDSATSVYGSANFMEREAYDMFGVYFVDHPNLIRILMPEDWRGHPQRKDYPLGGVEVLYKGATIPPPDERSY